MEAGDLFWQLGPDLAVRGCGKAPLENALDVVFGAFRTEADDVQGRILTLSIAQKEPGAWQVFADGQPVISSRQDHDLPVLLETVLTRTVVQASTSCVILHAAVVEIDGTVVLLPGERGAGKSTLALHCSELGGRYFGDDLGFFRASDRAVLSFPKAVTLKEGSFALGSDAPVYHDPLRGPLCYRIPAAAGNYHADLSSLPVVIFPEFDQSVSGVRSRRVKPELAAMSLVQQTCGGLARHESTMGFIAELVSKPAYYMSYSHSQAAASGIREILKEVLA